MPSGRHITFERNAHSPAQTGYAAGRNRYGSTLPSTSRHSGLLVLGSPGVEGVLAGGRSQEPTYRGGGRGLTFFIFNFFQPTRAERPCQRSECWERYRTCPLSYTHGNRTRTEGVPVAAPAWYPLSGFLVCFLGWARGRSFNGSAVMPEPSAPAGNWGMSSLTGFLEGSVLNVFASSPAEKAKGAGDRKNPGGGVGAGAMQVQTSKQKPLMGLSQHSNEHCGDCGATAASSKPRRTASSASLESDLPELGRLERTKTPNTSVATSDEEPACRGNDVSSKKHKTPKNTKRLAAFWLSEACKLDF